MFCQSDKGKISMGPFFGSRKFTQKTQRSEKVSICDKMTQYKMNGPMMYFFGKVCLFGAKILVRLCFLKSGYPNLLIVDDADINPDEHILHLKRPKRNTGITKHARHAHRFSYLCCQSVLPSHTPPKCPPHATSWLLLAQCLVQFKFFTPP